MDNPKPAVGKMIHDHAEFFEFDNATKLVEQLSARVRDLLSKSIQKKNRASLIVSGGTTPVALFKVLSNLDLEWDKIVISLVDERWVDTSDSESNENLVRSHLLKGKAAKAKFIGLKTAAVTFKAGESLCSERLKCLPMPFDIVILGMGSDGHTASLFADAKEFTAAVDKDSKRICMGIKPISASHERMTLTLPAILNTTQILVHIEGQAKRIAYEQAKSGGPYDEMPIRFILGQKKVPVAVYWAS